MSSPKDVVVKTGQLAGDLDALLSTNTVQAVLDLAAQLKLQAQIKAGVELLTGLLTQLEEGLKELQKVAGQLEALSGTAALLQTLAQGLEALLAGGKAALAACELEVESGLAPLEKVAHTASWFLQTGQGLLDSLPSRADLETVSAKMEGLKTTLAGYNPT